MGRLRITLAVALGVGAPLAAATAAHAGWTPPATLSPQSNHQVLTSVSALGGGAFATAWAIQPGSMLSQSEIQARLIDGQGAVGPILTLTDTPGIVDDPT